MNGFGRTIALLGVASLVTLLSSAAPQDPAGRRAGEELGLTVYTGNLALVRRTVPVQLASGTATVRIDDLPANIDVSSLLVNADGITLMGVHDVRRYQDSGSNGVLSLALDLALRRSVERLPLVFLTSGLGWSADYVMVVARHDRSAAIDGYVTIQNSSGATYEDAALQLLAGTIQRGGGGRYELDDLRERAVAALQAPAIEGAAFGDYHLYTLDAPLTLANGESRRLRLLGEGAVKVEKRYVLRGNIPYSGQQPEPQAQAVSVGYRVDRSGSTDLDREPLPAGAVRVYQSDAGGRLQLLGATSIANTPRGEDLWIGTGQAFDVVARRVQTDFERVGGGVFESAWRIELVNRGDTAVEVEVIETVSGDWEILSSNHEPEKLSASAVRFRVAVPADGESQLEYRVSTRS